MIEVFHFRPLGLEKEYRLYITVFLVHERLSSRIFPFLNEISTLLVEGYPNSWCSELAQVVCDRFLSRTIVPRYSLKSDYMPRRTQSLLFNLGISFLCFGQGARGICHRFPNSINFLQKNGTQTIGRCVCRHFSVCSRIVQRKDRWLSQLI